MLTTSITIPFLLLLVNEFCGTTPVTVYAASTNPNYYNNVQQTLTNLERSIAENKTNPPISQLLDELWLTVEQLWEHKTTPKSNEQTLQLPQNDNAQSNVHLLSQAYSAEILSQGGELSTLLRSRASEDEVPDVIYKVTPHKVTGDSRLVLSVVDMTFKTVVWHENDQSEYSILSRVLAYFWTISGETFGHSSHSVHFNRRVFEYDSEGKELLCLVWNPKNQNWETFKHFRLSGVDQNWVNCESYDPSEKSKPMAVGFRKQTETHNRLFGYSGVSEEVSEPPVEPQVESVNQQSSPQMAAALTQEKSTEATASNSHTRQTNVNCLGRVPRRDLPINGPMFTIIKQEMKKSISEEANLVTDINDLGLKTLRYELGEHSEVFAAKIAASSFNHNVGKEGIVFPAVVGGAKRPNLRMSRDFLKQLMYLKNLEIGFCITDREATDFLKSLGNSDSVASSIVTVTFIAPQDSHPVSPFNPPIEIEIPLTKSQRVHNPQCYSLDRFNTLQNSKCEARLEEGSLICRCSTAASFVVVDTPPQTESDTAPIDTTTPIVKFMRSGDDDDDVSEMQQVSSPENIDNFDQHLRKVIILTCYVVAFAVLFATFIAKHLYSSNMYRGEQRGDISRLSGHCYANMLLMSFIAALVLVVAVKNVGPLNGKFAEALASLIIISTGACLGIWKLILQDSFSKRKYMLYAGIYIPVIVSLSATCLFFKSPSEADKVLADELGDVVVYCWTAVLGLVLILDFSVGWSQQSQSMKCISNSQQNPEPDSASAGSETGSCPSEGVVTKTSTRLLFVLTAVLVAVSCVLTCVNIKTSNSLELWIVAILFAMCVSGYFLFRSVSGLNDMCRNLSIANWNWCMDNDGMSDDTQVFPTKSLPRKTGQREDRMGGDKVDLAHGDSATASGESLHDDENLYAGEEADESFNGLSHTTQTHV